MLQNKSILVTGSSGFLGKAFCSSIDVINMFNIVKLIRNGCASLDRQSSACTEHDLQSILKDIDVVVHFAGLAHVVKKSKTTSLDQYRTANRDFTLDLAKKSVVNGVDRFVFISSIGVNGGCNTKPFSEEDDPQPSDDYSVSKYEAEQGLMILSKESSMEIVIIRPPLVYGANAPGNLGRLISLVNKGMPLPFGAVFNKRSFIALDNLIDFVVRCIDHPKAANEVFLISDGEDVSLTMLLVKIGKAMGKSSRLIPVPVSFMVFLFSIIGKEKLTRQLFSNLQIDNSKAIELLDWCPMVTMDRQLTTMFELQPQTNDT